MFVFVNGSLCFSLSLTFENFTICNCTYRIHNVKLKGQRYEHRHTYRKTATEMHSTRSRTLCQGHWNCSQVKCIVISYFQVKWIIGEFFSMYLCVTSFNFRTTAWFAAEQKPNRKIRLNRLLWRCKCSVSHLLSEVNKCTSCLCATNHIIIIDNIRWKKKFKKKNLRLTVEDNENEKLTSPNWRDGKSQNTIHLFLLDMHYCPIVAPQFTI